ncbi:MAG: endo-1,4-beta-xylanase [Burkholderiales bacterium]|nr:endo-1,4-beta-xylanase [Burkholderiales bacterium]
MNISFKTMLLGLATLSAGAYTQAHQETQPSLKEAFSGKFLIGTAMKAAQINETDTASVRVIKEHFNAIVAENCMKSMWLQPKEGVFDFTLADKFVEFGERNNMIMYGHVLIWHSQAPAWFFTDSKGNDVTREVMIERMKTHIQTVMEHYKGRVKEWEVVNEAIMDDGTFRKTKFYEIIGEDYIRLAFQFAREADPDSELYYNDYSMALPGRREGEVAMVKKLQAAGLRIDGIGMQTHVGMDYPDLAEYEKSMEVFAALGVKIMITEMDITLLPFPDQTAGADMNVSFEYQREMNPYAQGLPDSVNTLFEKRYLDFFSIFLRHKDMISRVTLWGVSDQQSWRNNWPIPGRTDYPLLFDRQNKPKPVVSKIIEEALKTK